MHADKEDRDPPACLREREGRAQRKGGPRKSLISAKGGKGISEKNYVAGDIGGQTPPPWEKEGIRGFVSSKERTPTGEAVSTIL